MDRCIWQEAGREMAMEKKLRELFVQVLDEELYDMVLSNARQAAWKGSRVKIRPVRMAETLWFQEALYQANQVFHTNLDAAAMAHRLETYMLERYKQARIETSVEEITVLSGKKGTITIKRRKKNAEGVAGAGGAAAGNGSGGEARSLAHNRSKQYILKEGQPVDFLVGLGVQTPEGRVVKARYDKFRQINRYLEFIEDVLEGLPGDRTIRIVDFGCGKSYLTFAMYYYLHQIQGRDIQVTGLDLKETVIRHCNELARQLGYEGLHFRQGDISSFQEEDKVDMVVSLHACDKATDYSLEKAVKWGARVILAVPCCQHELNGQIRCDQLRPVLKYGLIKERMAALITDALRAGMLEQCGYDTQILEFIDMEHTPKNILIRAVKRDGMRPGGKRSALDQVMDFLQVKPTLQQLLQEGECCGEESRGKELP